MTIGLLWFDPSKDKPLKAKVAEAVSAYRSKPRFESRAPDTCYVHPSIISDSTFDQASRVRLVGMPTVCPHNFFVVHTGSNGGKDRRGRNGDGRGTGGRSPRGTDGSKTAPR